MKPQYSVFLLLFFCNSFFLGAQGLSVDDEVKKYKKEANEYLLTQLFDFNKKTRYLDYPYAEYEDIFFVREKSVNYETAKSFYGIVESSVVKCLNQEYLGNESKLQITLLPIVGVKAENILFVKSDHSYDGNFKLGCQIPVTLFDYFNLNFDGFWSLMYYNSIKNYYCFGFDVKSFFIRPFVLEASLYFHGANDILVQEYSAQFGFFIKSVNFFAGWKYLQGNCFYIGAKRYF